MNTIECYFPGEVGYQTGCTFAAAIYRDKLHMTITRYPDILFVAGDGRVPLACIGLNHSVHNVVFTEDPEIQEAIRGIPHGRSMGEQYLWASDHHTTLAMLLVSMFSSYASKQGIKNVLFTGTVSALRAVREIGAKPILLGPIKESLLQEKDRKNCATWFRLYKGAQACVLPTQQMERLNERMLHTHAREYTLGPRLLHAFRQEELEPA